MAKPRRARAGQVLPLVALPVILAIIGRVGTTSAMYNAHRAGAVSFSSAGASPPSVTPTAVSLELHVGDSCVNSPLATVTNTSRWSVQLSTQASGWLDSPASVSLSATALGPGEAATVSFTKSAVEGPTSIAGQVVVTANPGGFQTVIQVGGEVLNPAGAASEPYYLPPGCVSTPRPKTSPVPYTPLPEGDNTTPDGAAPSAEPDAADTPVAEVNPQ